LPEQAIRRNAQASRRDEDISIDGLLAFRGDLKRASLVTQA